MFKKNDIVAFTEEGLSDLINLNDNQYTMKYNVGLNSAMKTLGKEIHCGNIPNKFEVMEKKKHRDSII